MGVLNENFVPPAESVPGVDAGPLSRPRRARGEVGLSVASKVSHFPRIGIADAGRIYGVTARALRHYEDAGLLHAQRDQNNCRSFDGEAQRRIGWIAALRRVGVGLRDVREVLCAEDRYGRRRTAALATLKRRRAALERQLGAIDALSTELTQVPAGRSSGPMPANPDT